MAVTAQELKYPSLRLDNSLGIASAAGLRWSVVRSLTVGREAADVTIAVREISRRHALIEPDDSGCLLIDTQSRNGTAVNNVLLDRKPHRLRHGDQIVFAGIARVFYHDPDSTPVTERLGAMEGVWIDPSTETVYVDSQPLEPALSGRQFQLLKMLLEANGAMVSREQIIASLWPDNMADIVSNDAVDSLVKRLRRRLAEIEHAESAIEVVRGRGIKIRPSSDRKTT